MGQSGRRKRRERARRGARSRRLRAEPLEKRDLLAVVVDLGALSPDAGFVLNSVVPQDRAGFSVSSAGDVNRDGFDDLLIGAPVDPGFPAGTGQAYLVFGSAAGLGDTTTVLEELDTAGAVSFGTNAEDHAGFSVSGAGDINGDGFHDYLIGAPAAERFTDSGPVIAAGQAYAVFGGPAGPPRFLRDLDGTNGFQIVGSIPFDRAGLSVGDAGDVNGDGYDDMLIGAPAAPVQFPFVEGVGHASLIYGRPDSHPASVQVSDLDGTDGVQFFGLGLADRTGLSVSGIGDLNGDGFDDFAIGAPYADRTIGGNPVFGSGATYVVFGGFDVAPGLAALDGSNGFRLEGLLGFDRSGFSLSSAGDVNGDGFDDLLIGAPADADLPVTPGQTYVVYGKDTAYPANFDLVDLDGSNGFILQGIAGLDHAGFSVSSAGDVNGDGLDDLVIGAPFADKEAGGIVTPGAGEAYVVFGRDTAFPARLSVGALADDEGLWLLGDAAIDRAGYSVSSAGDLNGDGFDDLLIGAPAEFNYAVVRPGRAYVVYGGEFAGSGAVLGDEEDNALAGDGLANQLLGGVGDDTLVGGGGGDVLLGGQGNDLLEITDLFFRRIDGGRGTDTLLISGDDQTVALPEIANNRLTGIEVIDLSGPGDHTLVIGNPREVLNASDTSNRLIVRRDASDVVEIGDGWSEAPGETIDGVPFRVYTQGAAELLVTDLPPSLDINGSDAGIDFGTAFVEDAGPVAIVGAAITLEDDGPIANAWITLTNRPDGPQETISVTGSSEVSATFDDVTDRWILSGGASPTAYAEVLRTATYENSSQNPTEVDRVLELQISDGSNLSEVARSTISVTGVNDAPALDDSADFVLSEIEEDTSDPPGATVASFVPDGTITDPDGSPVEAIAVVAADSADGQWQYSSDGTTWLTLDGSLETTARLLTAADRVRFVPNADFNGTASLMFRAWDMTTGTAGELGDASTRGGMTAFSESAGTLTQPVTPVNDAPVLDAGAFPELTTISRGNTNSNGNTIAEILVDGSVTDVDGTRFDGLAIIGADETNGHWEFMRDGLDWTRITVSESSALLLGPNHRIRFVPEPDFFGEATFTFRAWDASTGTIETLADTTVNGGTTAFSTQTNTARIVVRDVDNLPTIDDILAPVVLPNGASSQIFTATGISDGGDGDEVLTVTAVSSDPSIVPDPTVSYTSPAETASLQLTPVSGAAGWSIVTVTVTEEDGDEVSESLAVSVGDHLRVWQNPFNALDVNADGFVVPGDVLQIINELNRRTYSGPRGNLPFPPPGAPPPFLDVNGDRFVVPNDALQLINFLNSRGTGEGEAPQVTPGDLTDGPGRELRGLSSAPQQVQLIVPQQESVDDHRANAERHDQSLRELADTELRFVELDQVLDELG